MDALCAGQAVELLVNENARIVMPAAPQRLRHSRENIGNCRFPFSVREQSDRAGSFGNQSDTRLAMRIEHHQAQVAHFAL